MDLSGIERVFVRAPNWVGDMVMAAAAFARIRQAFPRAHIVCGLRPYLRSIIAGSPYFDDYLEMPKARGLGGPREFLRQVRALRQGSFDLAIVLPNSQATGWITRLAGIPRRLGYKQGRPLTMTHGLRAEKNRGMFSRTGPKRVPTPMPEYYDRLLDLLDIPPAPAGAGLHTNDADRAWIANWLCGKGVGEDDELVLMNAGAAFGPSKLWVEESWVELAGRLKVQGKQPLFLAGPKEVELVGRIATAAATPAAIDPVIGLDKLKALIERAALVISTDTGPRHLAVAMHRPTVCLMGPNDRRYTDYALERQVVIQKDLDCVPCQRKVCPLGHQNCMKMITVDEVLAAGAEIQGRMG